MPSMTRDLLVFFAWMALAAAIFVVMGLLVVPFVWSLARPP